MKKKSFTKSLKSLITTESTAFVTIVGISCFDCLRTKASVVFFASVSMSNEGSTEPPALPSMMVKWTAKGEGRGLKKEKERKTKQNKGEWYKIFNY